MPDTGDALGVPQQLFGCPKRKDVQRFDCVKITSMHWHQEETRSKKRRWISGDPTLSVETEKNLKKTKYVPESLLRSSQVIESSLGLRLGKSYHVVQEYLQLFDPQTVENTVIFQKRMSFLLTKLKTKALNCVVEIIRDINVDSERNKSPESNINEIIPQIFVLLKSDNKNNIVKKLEAVFRDPINYRSPMKLTTIVNSQMISSIKKTLEQIDLMPKQTLLAMKRKLASVQVVPRVPVYMGGKQEVLIRQLKKTCNKVLHSLKEGDDLPEPFAKALSVMLLSIKLSLTEPNIETSEFFPFNPETVALQDVILRAIWTIPKITATEMRRLRCIVDPTSKLTKNGLRTGVIKYLTECLFECGDLNIPEVLSEAVCFINRKSRRKLDYTRRVSSKNELEHVMNISAQLREIIWENFPADDVEKTLSDAFDWGNDYNSYDAGDDIIIDDKKAYSGHAACNVLIGPGFCREVATEGIGDSEPADLLSAPVSPQSTLQASRDGKAPESQRDKNITGWSLSAPKSSRFTGLNGPTNVSIETISDETSVFAYQIIDMVLEGLLGTGGHENSTKRKHTRETKKIDILDSRGPTLLAQTVEELAPNFPRSGLEKMKKLMGLP